MADGKVEIEAEINNSKIDSGLKKLAKKLKDFTEKLKSSGMGNLGASISGLVSGVSASFKIATTSVKAFTNAVKSTTEAYRNQERAEIQLDTAVKNSPLLSGESARKLKDFASEMQKTTEYGDDYLFPFMAELVNSGRSYEEVTDIIKTASDISASGMMDFGSAVSSLNMTFQGTTGTLGRQISSIKNLTAEELKSGKAIEILKKQFSGTAEEVAKAVGSSEQLKNAWGDLKEEIGADWEKPLSKVRGWLKGIIDDAVEAKKTVHEINKADENIGSGNGGIKDYEVKIDQANKKLKVLRETQESIKKSIHSTTTDASDILAFGDESNAKDTYEEQLKQTQEEIRKLKEEIEGYTKAKKELQQIEEEEQKRIQAEAKTEEDIKKRQDELNKATEHYQQIIDKRDQTIKNLKLQAEALGEEVDEQAILNAEVTAYLEMSTDPLLPTMTKKQLKLVESLVAKQKELNYEKQKETDFMNALDSIDVSDEIKKSDVLKEQLKTLDLLHESFMNSANYEKLNANERLKIWDEYQKKRIKLEKDITEATKEENEKQKTSIQDILSSVNDFVTQVTNVISSMTELSKQHAEDEATVRNAELEKQFHDGLISEEEYYNKKEDLEKESAKKQYELQMWEWSASLVQIASSSAQAIANALTTQPTALGIAMASVIGSLGAVQMANAIRNKPIPPSFANGGIVGGGAYSLNDNIHGVNLKSGEMVLNQRQQQNLWRMAQGGGTSSGMQNNIQIKNYRGNDTTVTPQFTEDGIKILIRKTVADDLQNRKLNSPLLSAQNTMNGISYE